MTDEKREVKTDGRFMLLMDEAGETQTAVLPEVIITVEANKGGCVLWTMAGNRFSSELPVDAMLNAIKSLIGMKERTMMEAQARAVMPATDRRIIRMGALTRRQHGTPKI